MMRLLRICGRQTPDLLLEVSTLAGYAIRGYTFALDSSITDYL
jgi:hypothetical protein